MWQWFRLCSSIGALHARSSVIMEIVMVERAHQNDAVMTDMHLYRKISITPQLKSEYRLYITPLVS